MSQMGRAVKPEELHGFPFVVVQSLSHIQLLATPWIVAYQAFLSFTISWSLLRFMSIESVMLSNHLILCRSLLILLSIFPSIRIFSNQVAKVLKLQHQSFQRLFRLFSFRIAWFDFLRSKGLSRVFSSTTNQKHQFFSAQSSLW